MGRLLTSIILLAIGAALGAAGMYFFLGQGSASKVATISFYGDWRLNCPAPEETDRVCELVQSVTDKRTGETIFRLAVRRNKDGSEEMAIIAPFGILLQPGVGIALGEIEPRKVDIEVCDETGCLAVFPVDDKFFSAIRTRDLGTVVMTDMTGKPVSLPISLKGLDEGLSALRSQGDKTSLLDALRSGRGDVI